MRAPRFIYVVRDTFAAVSYGRQRRPGLLRNFVGVGDYGSDLRCFHVKLTISTPESLIFDLNLWKKRSFISTKRWIELEFLEFPNRPAFCAK